jgi:hypothetical protein
MRLTERAIEVLHASRGRTITGVFVPEPSNRKLEQSPGVLAIALDNGIVLNLYPTSTTPFEDSRAEYFRLDVEARRSPISVEYAPGDPVRWTMAVRLVEALVGDSISAAEVVREEVENCGLVDVGIQLVTSRGSTLHVSAERAGLPMTLAITLDGEVVTQ